MNQKVWPHSLSPTFGMIHEGADRDDEIGEREAVREIGDARLRMEEGADRHDRVDRIAHVELDDVRRREVRVANHRHVPSAVLLREERRAPVDGDGVDRQPLDVVEDRAHLLARRHRGHVARARLPQIAGETEAADELQRNLGPEDRQPIGLELGREGIQSGAPAENLLIDADDEIEGAERRRPDEERLHIDDGVGVFRDGGATGGLGGQAHVSLLDFSAPPLFREAAKKG
jgi:hypothetical protein